jgi:hypothetical protein
VGYIQSIRTGNQTTYFCINYPTRALDIFMTTVKSNPSIAFRDFYLDALAAKVNSEQWRFIIGQRRNHLLELEGRYNVDGAEYANPNTVTRDLHLLARDWKTLQKDCLDFLVTIDFLDCSYRKLCEHWGTPGSTWGFDRTTDMRETFEVLRAQGKNYASW